MREKRRGGAKPHARNKRQGGKSLTSEISVISGFGESETPPQSPAKKMTKSKISKNSCEKKRQGKTLMPEISVMSGFGGSGAPPQSPSKKMTKNKIFEKKSCEKKKGKGANYSWGGDN